MDKEGARFVLRCFRPDGSDAPDPDFAEALGMAAADRELGEWLARERAKDAEFSDALAKLELPDGLRQEILAGFAVERGVMPELDRLDALLIGALAMVTPPRELRGEILAAMQRSAAGEMTEAAPKAGGIWWRRLGIPLAAAAGIVLAFVLLDANSKDDGHAQLAGGLETKGAAVPVSFVESTAIDTLESSEFHLDMKNRDHQALFKFIRHNGRSCPGGAVPQGLKDVPGIGCRIFEIDGKPGSIICFRRGEGDIVHLVVFSSKDVESDLPDRRNPQIEQRGEWAVARWEEGGRVFVMLETGEKERLRELF